MPRSIEPPWPESGERPVLFLLDASSALERRLLESWIERTTPPGLLPGRVEQASLPASRRRSRLARVDLRLRQALDDEDGTDPLLVPLRVVWRAPEHQGRRVVRVSDILRFGDPRDPDWLRQMWIRHRYPERVAIVAGEPATVSQLRQRHQERIPPGSLADEGLAAFVHVQAHLALEQAERRLRGNRYKVPRFVREDLLFRRSFQAGLRHLAETTAWPASRIPRKAAKYLAEMAATHRATMIDLVASFTKFLLQRSYGGRISYDPERLAEVYRTAGPHPMVFLPTHKTYIDTLILQHVLYENDYPPNHTAAGINMSFWPVGPIIRRAGKFFIRRSFRDNPVYKFVVRQYIRYLVEKGFALEWYIEGGRSRSGKLREPSYGMLAYVVEAWRDGAAEDVLLIPVSIAYDQIEEVADYAAEVSGRGKRGESIRRLVEYVRGMRRPHGSIHLRIGAPLSVAAELDRSGRDVRFEVEKLAFEVCVAVNEVTPITPISLVTLALLGGQRHAGTPEDIARELQPFCAYVAERDLPTTEPLRLDSPERVARTLEQLVEHGVVTRHDEGPDVVYAIGDDQHLAAAYYRNTIIHFFVDDAIAELSLLAAAEAGAPLEAFWAEARRLRDVLKFDFFFPRRDEFRADLDAELCRSDPDWQQRVAAGDALEVLRSRPLLTAHWVLRPFLEAYRVMADVLAAGPESYDPKALGKAALALGRQYLVLGKLSTPESLSTDLFSKALELAENQGLLAPEAEDARKAFAASMGEVLERVARDEREAVH